MKRATRERLHALSGNFFSINADERADILDSDARQRREIRALRAERIDAVVRAVEATYRYCFDDLPAILCDADQREIARLCRAALARTVRK